MTAAAWLNNRKLIWGQLQSFGFGLSKISTLESAAAHRHEKLDHSIVNSNQRLHISFYNNLVTFIPSELVSPGHWSIFFLKRKPCRNFNGNLWQNKTENGVTFPLYARGQCCCCTTVFFLVMFWETASRISASWGWFLRNRLQQDDTKDAALDSEIYWIYFCDVTAVLGRPLPASSPQYLCSIFTFGFAFRDKDTVWKWENILEMSLLLADSAMTTGLLTSPEHPEKSTLDSGAK